MRGLTTILLDELADERSVVNCATYNGALALARVAGEKYDRTFAARAAGAWFEVYTAGDVEHG